MRRVCLFTYLSVTTEIMFLYVVQKSEFAIRESGTGHLPSLVYLTWCLPPDLCIYHGMLPWELLDRTSPRGARIERFELAPAFNGSLPFG